MSNNTRVFSFRYTHAYFGNRPTSIFGFLPSENTKQLMDRYGILISGLVNGFDLYANTSQALDEYLNHLQTDMQVASFDFEIQTEDPLFYNYTNLPIDWQGLLEFSSERSQYNALLNTFTLEEQLTAPQQTNTTATLRISFSDIINAISDYQEANYKINFAARATQWRYYIINNSNLSFENLTIDTGQDNIFGPATPETLENGQQALMFTSGSNKLSLSETPKYQFNLVAHQQHSSDTIFRGLPIAEPSNFNLITQNEETIVVSPLYIYI